MNLIFIDSLSLSLLRTDLLLNVERPSDAKNVHKIKFAQLKVSLTPNEEEARMVKKSPLTRKINLNEAE